MQENVEVTGQPVPVTVRIPPRDPLAHGAAHFKRDRAQPPPRQAARRAARLRPVTEQEGMRGAGRERSGAAPRTRPALCKGFSRLIWDVVLIGAQRKDAL